MPEHFAAGLTPHSVTEKYYFARGPQLVNRAVDTGPTVEAKLACLRSCRTMMLHMIQDLNRSVAEKNLRLPLLAGDPSVAIVEFTKMAVENRDRAAGRKYGLEYAEEFHYIGPDKSLDAYIGRNAVRL